MRFSQDEFWQLRPEQFHVLMKAYGEQQKREDLRAGVIASVFASVHGANIPPGQFFGHDENGVSPGRKKELEAILEAEKLRVNMARYEYARQRETTDK